MRSRPSAMPPCGGVPYSSASRKKPNRVARLLVADVQQPEDPALHGRVVDSDAAAADLAAVQHEVVGLRAHLARRRLRACAMSSSIGLVNGWCIGDHRLSSASHSSSGKSTTQRNSNWSGSSRLEPLRDAQPQLAEHLRRRVGLARRHHQQVAAAGGRAHQRRADRLLAHRLQDRALHAAFRGVARPDQALRAERLGLVGQRVQLLARLAARARNHEAAHHAPRVERSRGTTANVVVGERRDRSSIAIPQRRSGLSEPYFAIASAYDIRGNGVGDRRCRPP